MDAFHSLNSVFVNVTKGVIVAPFVYHTVNGIRHLWWDAEYGLSIPQVEKSGYVVLGSTAILTLAILAFL